MLCFYSVKGSARCGVYINNYYKIIIISLSRKCQAARRPPLTPSRSLIIIIARGYNTSCAKNTNIYSISYFLLFTWYNKSSFPELRVHMQCIIQVSERTHLDHRAAIRLGSVLTVSRRARASGSAASASVVLISFYEYYTARLRWCIRLKRTKSGGNIISYISFIYSESWPLSCSSVHTIQICSRNPACGTIRYNDLFRLRNWKCFSGNDGSPWVGAGCGGQLPIY